jgi:hypothetical protein
MYQKDHFFVDRYFSKKIREHKASMPDEPPYIKILKKIPVF